MSKIRFKDRERLEQTKLEEEPPPKRLKLVFREKTLGRVFDSLETAENAVSALEIIKDVEIFFPFKSHDCDLFLNRCFDNFVNFPPEVQSRLAELLRYSIDQNWFLDQQFQNSAVFILDSLNERKSICSESVSIFLSVLIKLAPKVFSCHEIRESIELKMTELTSSTCWQIRKLSIILLTDLIVLQYANLKNELYTNQQDKIRNFETQLLQFCCDSDERVRIASAESLIRLMKNFGDLGSSVYTDLCDLLSDSCSVVRIHALNIVRQMGEVYPELQVPGPNKNVNIRLVDDVFSKLCNAMHDISVEVRTVAAKLLGTMSNVGEKFLEQTLDKKLMNALKFMKNEPRNSFLSEWATGRKFGEDTAMEKIDEDLQALIPSGACGAFVSGLEDEYLAVRSASIDAVSHLSKQSKSFANKALDFLADMFNDEIEDVRLNAINSLRQLCQHIVLREAQMDTILSALDDASSDSREALRELLASCSLHSVVCLKMTIDGLMNNLKRYPQDKPLIWNCMKSIGYNHPNLVQPLVVDLLGYHAFFDMPEPCIDDSFYISKLLLVLNAAAQSPAIRSLFLSHTWRHYDYLRNSNPHLTPGLEDRNKQDTKDESISLVESLSSHTDIILKMALASKENVKCDLLKLTLKNLDLLCKLSTVENGAKANFLHLYCSTLLNFYVTRSMFRYSIDEMLKKSLIQLLLDTFKMELLWTVDSSILKLILSLRFSILNCMAGIEESFKATLLVCKNEFLMLYPEDDIKLKNFDENLAENYLNEMPIFGEDFKQKTLLVSEPDKQSERVLRFSADLVAAIPFVCRLSQFKKADFGNLRLRITYPDQKSTLQRIRCDHIKSTSDETCRLRTSAFVADSVWTEVSTIEVALVSILPQVYIQFFDAEKDFITLCEPIPVRIFPKAKC